MFFRGFWTWGAVGALSSGLVLSSAFASLLTASISGQGLEGPICSTPAGEVGIELAAFTSRKARFTDGAAGPAALAGDLPRVAPRVYVPHVASNTVQIIDPATFEVLGRFRVGKRPHHIVPSWDLKTLWVTSVGDRHDDASVTPIDAATGKVGAAIPVDDPYNMYFTMNGDSAIVVAEEFRRLDFRDPRTMRLQGSVDVPGCTGINHADFSLDGRFAVFSCEYGAALAKVDVVERKVVGYLALDKGSMPQDIRIAPDGTTFFVADMAKGGVHVIDAATFAPRQFIATGPGAHGLYPNRERTKLFVANRGTDLVRGKRRGAGSVSVIDFTSGTLERTWPIPRGGSPDMGALSEDGATLWLSGRFDDVVYAIDTTTGAVRQVDVDGEPHGLTFWPQSGQYSLGHTGILR